MHRSIHQLVCALALAVIGLPGQETVSERSSEPFTLKAAVDLAATNFPAIRASMAQVAEAESGIALAKTAFLPEAEMRLGVNFATRNNVFGLIFPNDVIPGISGPVQDESTIMCSAAQLESCCLTSRSTLGCGRQMSGLRKRSGLALKRAVR